MPVAKNIHDAMQSASWIRRMFERGAELKRTHGAANVFDFTLGNPILEPPPEFYEALRRIAARSHEGLHRYMPNAGFPEVRQAIANKLSADRIFPEIHASHVVMSIGAGGGLNAVL